MEKDEIQLQLQRWLSRKTSTGSIRQVTGLSIALASDVGNVRTENQDKLVLLRAQVTSQKSFLVGVLCDGMGGMVDGKGCAELAVSSFISSCIRYRKLNLKERLLKAVHSSNEAVYNKYQGDGGATLSAFILDSDKQLEAINVGDSRIYVETSNSFNQVTTDDTIIGQLPKDFIASEVSQQLLQYIGIGSDLEPHSIELPYIDNISKILMTSDGSHYIAHETLKDIISHSLPPAELTKRLINVAKWCSGHDNASALLLTDLSSLFLNSEDVQTGTIDVWDPFGDVQLIGIEKTLPQEALAASNKTVNTDASVDSKINSSSEDENDSRNALSTKTKSRAKSKAKPKAKPRKRKEKNEAAKVPEKPQLRMDFEK